MDGCLPAAINMQPIKANNILDTLFSKVPYLSKTVSFINVRVENCTVFIPVNNLDETKVPEFKDMFIKVYEQSRRD